MRIYKCNMNILIEQTQIKNGTTSRLLQWKSFQCSPLFSLHGDALQIFLYFDELETCNSLGSKAKIHKLGNGEFINMCYSYYVICRKVG